MQLEQTLEQEQEQQISKLTKKIERLEKDVLAKQSTLERVRGKEGEREGLSDLISSCMCSSVMRR